MCFLLKLIQRPLFGQRLVVLNILPPQVCWPYLLLPHAFASEFEELALAAEGRMFKSTAGTLDCRGDKS